MGSRPINWNTFKRGHSFLLLCVTILFILSLRPVQAGGGKIIISSDNHPPLIQGDESPGNEPGIMTDIVRAAFRAKGVRVEYLAIPAARISWSLLENKVSATVGPLGWFDAKNARHRVHFIPVYPASFHLYYMRERFPQGLSYTDLEELKPYKIGYMHGGAANGLLEKAGLSVERVNDRDQNTRKLFLGRIDLLVTESIGGWTSIRNVYPNQVDKFRMVKKVLMEAPGGIIFIKDQLNLIQTFQAGFSEIKQNGIYMNIVNRYYNRQWIPEKLIEFSQ